MEITHAQQQKIWDEEHKNPYVLIQMDSHKLSSGVVLFIDWLKQNGLGTNLKGIELGCGKGRNVIGLAKLGSDMIGIDFSSVAIKEARRRAGIARVANKAHCSIHDATQPWPFTDESFDLAIDCFASTDIECPTGRKFATDEIARILRPGGYLLTYLLSPEDEYHKQMMQESPASERNAFLHPSTGKFEKAFDRDEILALYDRLELIAERRIEKVTEFFGKKYNCFHHWMIFRKN